MHNALDYFGILQVLLHLGKLKDNANQARKVGLRFDGDGVAELKAVEGYVNDVLVQQQVLRLLVGEHLHKRFDKRVSQLGVRIID